MDFFGHPPRLLRQLAVDLDARSLASRGSSQQSALARRRIDYAGIRRQLRPGQRAYRLPGKTRYRGRCEVLRQHISAYRPTHCCGPNGTFDHWHKLLENGVKNL